MNPNKKNIIKKSIIILFILMISALLIYLGIDLYKPIKEAFDTNSLLPIEEKFISYGIKKYLFIAVFQAFLLITTVVPNQIIQIIAGFTCGAIPGMICCMAGILIGNIIIYIIFRRQEAELNDKQISKLKSDDEHNNNKSFLFLLSLYFIPGVPYGVAAIYAARKKTGFLKYILFTTLGAIPTTVFCTLFGNFAIEEKYLPFTILFSVYCLIIVITLGFKEKIANHLLSRSFTATLIWLLILFINAGVSIYFAIVNNLHKLFINIIFLVGIIGLYFILNKPVSKIFERLSRKYDMKYFQTHARKPRPLLYSFIAYLIRPYFFIKFKVKVNKESIKNIKGPAVLLFNHPSRFDFLYSFLPVLPKRVSPVVAFYYFCNYRLGRLLNNLGAFPKFLYQADVSAIKNIIKVIKNNGILGIAPEGRLAAYGALEKVIPSTAKMLKKLAVPVYQTKINGAYLTAPKWAKSTRRGQVSVDYELILSAEDIKNMSVNEILNVLNEKGNYDDFKWQEENHIYYKGKNFAEGLEDILYICPVCGKEYSYSSKDNTIKCNHCHTEVTLDNYYNFITDNNNIPKNIRDWYLLQKEIERKNIEDPNYSLTSHVTLKHPHPKGKGFKVVGEGYTTLTHNGITFKGTINGEEKEILFKIENLPAVPFGVREDFEIYHHNTLYYFIPDNLRECVKWSVVSEQMYQKYLDDNNLSESEIE